MDINGKDTKHTRRIARRIHFLRNGENFKMKIIDWRDGGLKLAYISIENIIEHDLAPRMKSIMVTLDN